MNLTPRRFLAVWGVGTILLGLGTFWGVHIVVTGILQGPGHDALPPVTLTADAKAFVASLPVLGKEKTKPSAAAISSMPRIQIPSLGVNSAIVELPLLDTGWFLDGLETRIGHLDGTDAPGGTGNAVFAGHITLADGSSGPLAKIETLLPGAQIIIISSKQRYIYEVTGQQQVAEDRLEVVYPTKQPQLTLITCSRWSWLNGRYTSRQVVTARLVSTLPLQ